MSTNVCLNKTSNEYPFIYARPYKLKQKPSISSYILNNIKIKFITIPDGFCPNATIIESDPTQNYRLHILASHILEPDQLKILDGLHETQDYPIYNLELLQTEIINYEPQLYNFFTRFKTSNEASYKNWLNFNQTSTESINTIGQFVEYKLFSKRNETTKILRNFENNTISKLLLPPNSAIIVIVMPENFTRTGNYKGYFKFNNNIIAKVFSNVLLSSKTQGIDIDEISDIRHSKDIHHNRIIDFFSKQCGFVDYHTEKNQIVITDKYFQIVIGELSNILPLKQE